MQYFELMLLEMNLGIRRKMKVYNLPRIATLNRRLSLYRGFAWNIVFLGYPFCIMKANFFRKIFSGRVILYLVKNEATASVIPIFSKVPGVSAVTPTMIVPVVADSRVSISCVQ